MILTENRLFRRLMIIVASVLLVPVVVIAALGMTDGAPKQTLTTYHYDAERETWLRDVTSVSLPPNPDGTQPRGSNTIIIRLDEHNPVKQIFILEALITGENATEPVLEIAGHDSGGGGKINIGTLLFKRVDAERLNIHDTNVVRSEMGNAVAQDNELSVNVTAVNVVRIGRGGPSSLFIGTTRSDLTTAGIVDISNLPAHLITINENGVRADRIRILGPSSGTAFAERILILNTSVFGQIEVKDVNVQDLIIKDVTLDDSF